jgi:hypothetical protein
MAEMTPLVMSLAAFACIFSGTFLGIFIRRRLPGHHLSGDTKDIVRQGTALIATLASLVLGLLIASANGRYEAENSHVKQIIANIILLDNALAQYGPEAGPVRVALRSDLDHMADKIWSESRPAFHAMPFQADSLGLAIYDEVLKLTPKTDAQRFYQSRAMDTLVDIGKTRLLLYTSTTGSIPLPFLIVLVGWLALIFASISLFAESNARTITILCIFSIAASAAIFLILELSQPFVGLMTISDEPLRHSLAALPR